MRPIIVATPPGALAVHMPNYCSCDRLDLATNAFPVAGDFDRQATAVPPGIRAIQNDDAGAVEALNSP